MKTVYDDLKNNTIQKIYLLYGEDSYIRQDLKNKLKEAIAGDDEMNYLYVSGAPKSPESLRDFTDTMPFFHDTRLVVLDRTGLFKGASEGYDEWLKSLPDYARVVFSETEVDKRNKLYKTVTKEGYAAECAHPDERTVGAWVQRYLKQRDTRISREAYDYVVASIGNDMAHIALEMDKLCCYVEETKEVQLQDARNVIAPSLENRVFDLMDAAVRGDEKNSMRLYGDLLALHEPPMRIHYLLIRQLNQLYLSKKMFAAGKNSKEVEQALSVREFVVRKLQGMGRRFSEKQLETLLTDAVQSEQDVKSGLLSDNLAVELTLFSLLSKK